MRYAADTTMAKSFDRIADKFDETRSYPDEVMSVIVDAVERAMTPAAKVLDAGVGTGRFALPLQRKGFEVVGVDVSRKMLDKAVSKGVRNLVRSDVCAMPFKEDAFDYALSVHLIHLIPEWRTALDEIGRVTRKGLISVVSDRDRSQAEEMRRLYCHTCERLGHEVRHAGPRERELSDIIPPDTTIEVTVQERPVEVGKMLDNFESRTFSDQWDVPEEVHRGAVAALRDRYEGVDTVVSREDISLIVWSADRVRTTRCGP